MKRILLALTVVLFAAVAQAAEKPNILFIFTDDQCFQTIGALGYDKVETPNLDRLMRRGTLFTHAYNPGSWHPAVCIASRTMLNTGRFLWNAEKAEKQRKLGPLWPELMHDAGYETYLTGKWHIQADATKVFDRHGTVRGGMPNQSPAGYHRPPTDGRDDEWSPSDPKFGGFWTGGEHWSEVTADEAIDFLKKGAGEKKPFFMYVAFNAPHDPHQSPQKFVDRYPIGSVPTPKNFLPEYPQNEAMGSGRGLRDETLAPFPRTPEAVTTHRREYFAQITHLDEQIGRLLDALDTTGEAKNTYIFLTSDHGLATGQHGLMGKQNMYDHSVRVPLIVAGPNVPKGKKIDAPVYLQDIMPTTLAIAGVQPPAHVDFQSLLPLLEGKEASPRVAIYGAYMDRQRSISKQGWKLILYPKAKVAKLYHTAEDPHEMHDVSDVPANLSLKQQLFADIRKMQEETGDALDLNGTYPDLAKLSE